MLIPVEYTGEEKGLLFVIEGKEWKLYSPQSSLHDIKKEFISAPATTGDGMKEYKYIGLTTGERVDQLDALAVTYDNKFIIIEDALVGKCTFPVRVKDLSCLVNEIARHYEDLGYEIILDRN